MSTHDLLIEVGSHGCVITILNPNVPKGVLGGFLDVVTQKTTYFDQRRGVTVSMQGTTFASDMLEEFNRIGIHRNHLPDFMSYLERLVTPITTRITYREKVSVGKPSKFTMNSDFSPREAQIPVVNFVMDMLEKDIGANTRVLYMPTGTGKTSTSLYCFNLVKRRVVVMMQPREITTWKNEIPKKATGMEDRIRVVDGGSKLRKLIVEGKRNKITEDIIFISSNTFHYYLSEYEKTGKSTYGTLPENFFEVIGADTCFTDEAHERLEFNYRVAILTNTRYHVYLSGTLKSNDGFKNQIYETIYPLEWRISIDRKPYITAYALGYHLAEPSQVKYRGGTGMYSHNTFEDWIMKRKVRLTNYLSMIGYILQRTYIEQYVNGTKCLIFFASVDLCKLAAETYKIKHPHLRVSSYNAGDPDEDLYESDIICTTVLSAGVGKDIPMLTRVIATIALDSRERNLQLIGRLRDLSATLPGVEPTFYYLVCKDIPTHLKYHDRKKHVFEEVVKTFHVQNLIHEV